MFLTLEQRRVFQRLYVIPGVNARMLLRGVEEQKREQLPMKPTLADLKAQASAPDSCPLCERPNYHPTDHHMVPRCRGGRATETLCRDCHKAIHATFTNKQLEREYHTIESLLAHEGFRKMIAFIAKQDGRVRIDLHGSQKRRGRNG